MTTQIAARYSITTANKIMLSKDSVVRRMILAVVVASCWCCCSLNAHSSSQLVAALEPPNGLVMASDQTDQLVGRQLGGNPNQQQQVSGGGGGGSHLNRLQSRQFGDTINDIHIECNSDHIAVTLTTQSGFNGMIYPKGLSKNSSCMMEYHQLAANITYRLPLKSCNTMSSEVEDGVEYFNTVMVQPHRRLVTNQGRGYHVRCRYQTKERTITNQEQQLSVNLSQVTPAVLGSASMPSCTMRIYSAQEPSHELAAENVKIGDELQLVISLDEQQEVYGLLVTNCLVRDGMNWGEQPLVDDRGCPVDEEIMPQFSYGPNLTRASVTFQAHKFPYTSSVYYQCNVRLCFREGGCRHVPPACGPTDHDHPAGPSAGYSRTRHRFVGAPEAPSLDNELGSGPTTLGAASGTATGSQQQQQHHGRRRRWVDAGELDGSAPGEILADNGRRAAPGVGRDLSMEVSSGLHVEETALEAGVPAEVGGGSDPMMAAASNNNNNNEANPTAARLNSGASSGDGAEATEDQDQDPQAGAKGDDGKTAAADRRQSERDFCMSLRKLAIAVSLASLLLMTAIIIMIACMIQRRKRERLEAQMYNNNNNNGGGGGYAVDDYAPYSNRAYCRD